MTLAEQLAAELANDFDKQAFLNLVAKRVKQCGEAYFICDHHVGTSFESCQPTIAVKHKEVAIKIACAEGFKVHDERNCYGVRGITFTL